MNQRKSLPPNVLPAEIDALGKVVVDAAYIVHKSLGPGLLESVYESCLAYELQERGLTVNRQVQLPVIFKGMEFENGYRIDLLVNDCTIIELKAVDTLLPIHQAQLLTYLKLSGHRLGYLINFNVPLIRYGIKRLIL